MTKDSVRRHEICSPERGLSSRTSCVHPIRSPRLPMQSRERCRNSNSRKLRVLARTNDISAYERRSGQLLPSCGFRAESPAHRCRALGLPTLAIIDLQCCAARSDVGDQERSRPFGPTSETPPDCIPRLNEWKDENEKNSDRNRNNNAPERWRLILFQATSDLVDRVSANQLSPTVSAGESACARA